MNWTKVGAYGGAGVVGAVAAVVSFGHLRHLAATAGESPLASILLPVSVDGLLVSAAGVMVMDWQAGRSARTSARVAFAAGCIATVSGNVASATPTPLGWVVASWAPLALLLVTEMLVRGHGRPKAAPDSSKSEPRSHRTRGDSTRKARKSRTRRGQGAERVAAAMAANPAASIAELSRMSGVSRSTVRRSLNGNQPATVPAQREVN